MSEFIFSYGTLRTEKVQAGLFGRVLVGKADVLNGYRIAAIEVADRDFVSRGEASRQSTLVASNDMNDRVEGVVLAVSQQELLVVDRYEPREYSRELVELASGTRAWIYRA